MFRINNGLVDIKLEWVWLGVRGLEGVLVNILGLLVRLVIIKYNCVMGFVYGMWGLLFIGMGEWRGYLY